MRLAIDHLASLGHRDIVHVDGGHAPGAAERRAGYLDAMQDHGLSAHALALPGDYTEHSGAAAARALLTDPDTATAVIAGNDQCAVGLLDELRTAGIEVPGRVSVVGYDDSRLARLARIDRVTRHHGARPARVFKLAPHLVVRGSTGPAIG